jgi:YidC/Oxa1 family membrane protein insertase
MDRNTIIGLVLIFAIFIGFTILNTPSKEELEQQKWVRDSIQMVRDQEERARAQAMPEAEKAPDQVLPVEEKSPDAVIEDPELRDRLGVFAGAATGHAKEFVIENDVIKIRLTNVGGKIVNVELKDYQTYDSLPLILFNNDDATFGYTFFANSRRISTNELFFEPHYPDPRWRDRENLQVSAGDSLRFAMRLYATTPEGEVDRSRYIEYLYVLQGDDFMMDYRLSIVGLERVIDPGTGFIDLSWKADLSRQEQNLDQERSEATVYYKYHEDAVDYLSERKDDDESIKIPVKWISFKTRFFSATLIAEEAFRNADLKVVTDEQETDEHYLKSMEALIGVPYIHEPNHTVDMNFYFGPNKFSTLKSYDLELQRQIPLGWSFFLLAWINIYAVIPVFDWLGGYGWNYGIVILILTILLKIVLFPIAYKTYKSSAKMRVLKPEIEELSKKFPKTEDAMKKQQATMSLYKKAGVNPMAGCVPMLLQFPILIALFRFFPSSIELRQEAFLWAHDLSSYDSILDLPFTIPFYGSHVSLFTLLMTISTIIYTKLNSDMMGSSSTQMPGMKTMMYIMPVMFLGIFNNFASGLSYYYFLANVITFAQMFLIRKTIDEDKIRKQIQINKTKPVKKSKFQAKLEELSKQRSQQQSPAKRKRR